jgi:hypothetical protein
MLVNLNPVLFNSPALFLAKTIVDETIIMYSGDPNTGHLNT